MKNFLVTLIVMALGFPICLQASDGDGIMIGATASVSLKDETKTDCGFWSIGFSGAYRYNLTSLIYVMPEIAIEYTKYYSDSYYVGSSYSYDQNFNFLGTHLAFNAGVNFGSGFSFFTGPQVRYTCTGEEKGRNVMHIGSTEEHWEYDFEAYTGLHKNQVSAQWSFGFNKDFGRIYANVRYSQQMTKIKNGHTDQNYFRFSVGYRF